MIRYKLLYEMIMFLKLLATGRSLMVVSLLHKIQGDVIALLYRYAIAIVAKAIVDETTM